MGQKYETIKLQRKNIGEKLLDVKNYFLDMTSKAQVLKANKANKNPKTNGLNTIKHCTLAMETTK